MKEIVTSLINPLDKKNNCMHECRSNDRTSIVPLIKTHNITLKDFTYTLELYLNPVHEILLHVSFILIQFRNVEILMAEILE